ncbi:NADAR family protein [Nonomuraea zeae]|uniref:NADAR family protein n=1 Tax=Nonomuraea zeae TaxID=1642303 RepID=A0A5S4G1Y8_9ACTN|nr:NADAR family protein [Nonomuraea zeae]TMR27003.1 NADAR family protein [Nonomuraea zeae]
MSEDLPLPMSVGEAIAAEQDGRPLKFLYFWGHRPARDGGVGPGCLSQWWPVSFTEGGHTYASAEHYMMAHKAWLFGDEESAERILASGSPGEAKKLGRTVRGFDEATWDAHRFDIVVRGSTAKFGQHPELAGYLLGTVNRVLVEASPLDRVWGIGLAADDPRAAAPSTWQGLNLLGFALMSARNALRDQHGQDGPGGQDVRDVPA